MKKRVLLYTMCFLLFFSSLFPAFSEFRMGKKIENIFEIGSYQDLRYCDLSALDLSAQSDLLYTLEFNTETKWPSVDKLPKGFDPNRILEYGKQPGLNTSKAHRIATGKGVHIAYIDQNLSKNIPHEIRKSMNLKYYEVDPVKFGGSPYGQEGSMHGPAVLSLLTGEYGIAPDATVHYIANPAWMADQRTHAEALYKLVEINKRQPEDQKIKIAGFSDAVDPSEKNPEAFRKAVEYAEKNGIMVFTVARDFETIPLSISPFLNKDMFQNYKEAYWAKDRESTADSLYVPSSRTTASEVYFQNADGNLYEYSMNAGVSWCIPQIVGTVALGLEINPRLGKAEAVQYLFESGYPYKRGVILNPEGFVKLVRSKMKQDHTFVPVSYRYLIYNSSALSDADLKAVKQYTDLFEEPYLYFDVKNIDDARILRDMLKRDSYDRKGLIGIQIIGSSDEVPAFDVEFKIQQSNKVDQGGSFKTDFFYTNFVGDSRILGPNFSIFKAFDENLPIGFVPKWNVVRLNLGKGEIAPYFQKYFKYLKEGAKEKYVNFSNPIFASDEHSDDFSYFMTEVLDKKWKLLGKEDYTVYGNREGRYPVLTKTAGGFTREGIKKENQLGVREFIINTHGQENNIDQCIFDGADPKSERRVSFLNSGNLNQVLEHHPYHLDLWTCLNGHALNKDNLVHTSLTGKCISAIAASGIISNNGVNCRAEIEDMKIANFYYFYLAYFEARNRGYARDEAFHCARRAYAEELMKHTDQLQKNGNYKYGNYQYNLHNLLSNHYYGVISPKKAEISKKGPWHIDDSEWNRYFQIRESRESLSNRIQEYLKTKSDDSSQQEVSEEIYENSNALNSNALNEIIKILYNALSKVSAPKTTKEFKSKDGTLICTSMLTPIFSFESLDIQKERGRTRVLIGYTAEIDGKLSLFIPPDSLVEAQVCKVSKGKGTLEIEMTQEMINTIKAYDGDENLISFKIYQDIAEVDLGALLFLDREQFLKAVE